MNDFITAVSSQIGNWPKIIEAIKPIDQFIASALTKDGPVHMCSSVWGMPLEEVLRLWCRKPTLDGIPLPRTGR
jgi:hypothetical protein